MAEIKPNSAYLGMNLDSVVAEVKPGQVTFALNAQASGFDGNSITYQNEQGLDFCVNLPGGYEVIGTHNIIELETVIFFLANKQTNSSEIGKVVNDSCIYETVINGSCLNFSIERPILKAVHKITACTVEIYWTDNFNPRRWIDLLNLPFKEIVQGNTDQPCNTVITTEIDCNKLNVQPNFSIPEIGYTFVTADGSLLSGTYQFAIQYSNGQGDPYTSYYSVTNPISINDYFKITPDFNYATNKSIQLEISAIDTTGLYDYFNLAVIKTINNIASVDLVGTFQIQTASQKILYTGQSSGITLTINDIFEKFPVFDTAGDLTTVQDVLVWNDLTSSERISYQQIANQINLQWVSYILPPAENGFANPLNTADFRGYLRDEIYAFDMVLISKNGYQSDRFPIPGRRARPLDVQIVANNDTIYGESICEPSAGLPRWQVYNTAAVNGFDPGYDPTDPCYQGAYQFGEFAYWESTDTYPCNEAIWGDLQGTPIRHHKFPDSTVTHHHSNGSVYPLGVRIDMQQIWSLIQSSSLTQEQKDNIAQIKIVRGDRAVSKSIQAKGLFFNVGEYTKLNTNYFYPNYPFNDLRPDPFIKTGLDIQLGQIIISDFTETSSVPATQTTFFSADIPANQFQQVADTVIAQWSGYFANQASPKVFEVFMAGAQIFDHAFFNVTSGSSWIITSTIKFNGGQSFTTTTTLVVTGQSSGTFTVPFTLNGIDPTNIINLSLTGSSASGGLPSFPAAYGDIVASSELVGFQNSTQLQTINSPINGFGSPDSQRRFTFHSPDTSFYQPFLGNVIKLDSAEYGGTLSHFVEVKNHSKYKFPSLNSYLTSLAVGVIIGFASATVGTSDQAFDGEAAFTAFGIFNDIIFKLIPNRNMAYTFNSVGSYVSSAVIPNDTGNKIRQTDIQTYLAPGYQGVGDISLINNYQRESSVYLRSTSTLPYPDTLDGVPIDNSRFTASQVGCSTGIVERDISAYYGSIKSVSPDQYGQIYSYPTVDTGFQSVIDMTQSFKGQRYQDIFGGDTFINRFALKRKYPFFLDNRVNYPDNADVFYDELGNIGYPTYWFSTDIQQGSGGKFGIGQLFGVKVNNFDCKNGNFFYKSGKIYLFAYGIVDFYVESSVNVDYRQAYNSREGEYYPHVSGGIPDDWLQEIDVPIAQDNTYTYNKTFSKQNIENNFTVLPVDFIPGQQCVNNYPNKAIYSDRQEDPLQYKKNNWLVYRPVSFFDFPLNYGKLTSLEGLENRAVLARFENKSMIYNALLTINTSNPQAAYLGNDNLFKSSPPIDFAETDLGFAGSQNKFFLKTEFGNISTDAKRGDVFIMNGQKIDNIGDKGLNQFLNDNLPFQILKQFPNYNTDNHYKGVGLHGAYDNKYDRFVMTKLDYLPLSPDIIYNASSDTFSIHGMEIELTDTDFFCPQSFTLSYWFTTQSWVSFHSYLPNFYIGATSKFYSGNNSTTTTSVWRHNTNISQYNTYYGVMRPYIVEYPYAFKFQDEIIQSVSDYSKVNTITSRNTFVQTNNSYFNKAIVYNDQQSSGILNLITKPQGNLQAYMQYPIYRSDSKDIMYTKSDNFYNYNSFWDVVKDYSEPIWGENCSNVYIDKVLNQSNMDYTPRSFKKYQIRAKDCKIRHILDNQNNIRITSQFIATDTSISYK